MCFGSKDKSNDPAPKPAPVPQSSSSTTTPKASMPQDYAPPPGPPPSHGQSQSQSPPYYAPPPGPPPSQHTYAPPPGPPSSDTKNNPFFNSNPGSNLGSGSGSGSGTDYAPPPGPPPSHRSEKQQHDWQTAVPDTSLLPPPPNFFSGFDRSPANNASEEDCEAGESWCRQYPLYGPMPLSAPAEAAARTGHVAMYAPPAFSSAGGAVTQARAGVWAVSSCSGGRDTCFATYPPLYHAAAHSPLVTQRRKKTVYYEVRILERGSRSEEISLSLGYVAPPYPSFRLPGWHRGSLGVHGDDGHRYVNDRWGGKAFTTPFKRGEVIGLGMDFFAPGEISNHGNLGVEVFLTRDGVETGRWNLHEETDKEQDLPVTGLEGYHDLCAAVGAFDKVAFEVVFAPELWRWRGYEG
ncbi:hypothetical protein F5Y11DRAFT_327398 [Daldinia sp. FL1419]|nr:hypothetical protein F5Y11DRAFT_327398 [Daldinia sp. FL1419]